MCWTHRAKILLKIAAETWPKRCMEADGCLVQFIVI